MDYYYLDEGGKTVGPVPDNVLQALHGTGLVRDATLVAAVGSDEWVSFDSQFAPSAKKLPPVPKAAPPLVPSAPSARQGSGAMGIKLIFAGLIAILGVGGLVAWVALAGGKSNSEEVSVAASVKNDVLGETVVPTSKSVADVATPSAPRTADTHKIQASNSKVSSSDKGGTTMPVTKSDPLAEWYEFGFRQGQEASKVFKAFGIVTSADRAHVAQLIKNMELDAKDTNPEALNICFDGYRDAVEGRTSARRISDSQKQSILPSKLRGYHKFAGDTMSQSVASSDTLRHAIDCTVLIWSHTIYEELGTGSGFFIAPGVVVTNQHVVKDSKKLLVRMPDKKVIEGNVIAVSHTFDIALVRVARTDHPIFEIGDCAKVQYEAPVVVIGFPRSDEQARNGGGSDLIKNWVNLDATTNSGTIANPNAVFAQTPAFHLNATINRGNSGGPLVDSNGRVIGINTWKIANADVERFNYAIKISAVLDFIQEQLPDADLKVEN